MTRLMQTSGTDWATVRRVAETIAIGAVGGIIFHAAGFPAGLVSGSIVAAAIAALAGRPLMVPAGLTRVILVLVGIALGSVVTPDTLKGFATYPVSIALLAVSTVAITAAAGAYLLLVHRWNAVSALLGASPGALAQAIAMSAEIGADARGIVVVQTMRVVMLAIGIPAGLAYFGLSGGTPRAAAAAAAGTPFGELAILVIVSTSVAVLLYKTGFAAGWLFGAMLGSAALHGSGLIEARLPWWLADGAMVTMGAVTGSRFASLSPRMLLSYLLAAIGSFAVGAAVASAFAIATVMLLPVRAADVVMAFSPGAQDTMMLLALALQLDPVFVGAHHLARYVLVSLGIPLAANVIVRRTKHGSRQ
jgi:membrane AbrB-like protein